MGAFSQRFSLDSCGDGRYGQLRGSGSSSKQTSILHRLRGFCALNPEPEPPRSRTRRLIQLQAKQETRAVRKTSAKQSSPIASECNSKMLVARKYQFSQYQPRLVFYGQRGSTSATRDCKLKEGVTSQVTVLILTSNFTNYVTSPATVIV